MKLLHRNLLIGIHDALEENFFEPNKVASRVLDSLLKRNKKWGSQDRSVVAEIFYNVVRWKKRLEYYAGEDLSPKNIYKILLAYLLWTKTEYRNFEEFSAFSVSEILSRIAQKEFPSKAVEYSIPEWLEERLKSELGANWEKETKALNEPAATILRANPLKIQPKALLKILEKNNIPAHQLEENSNTIILDEKKNVLFLREYENGFFEIQDASSQKVAPFLEVEKNMKVIDACAGAGGKTLHLASLMKNTGEIIALDIHSYKLKELKNRARRAGFTNIITQNIEDQNVIQNLHQTADRLLLDAPCSGLGVLKRNPDSKWKMTEDFLKQIQKTQEEILQNYSPLVKPGGKMVYATCSILPSENHLQVEKFLSKNPEFILQKEVNILPSSGYDGFYMALIERTK